MYPLSLALPGEAPLFLSPRRHEDDTGLTLFPLNVVFCTERCYLNQAHTSQEYGITVRDTVL